MGAYRPQPGTVPFLARLARKTAGAMRKPTAASAAHAHKRTASIVSLIGPDERSADEGWGAPWGIVPPAMPGRAGSAIRGSASRVGVSGDVTPRSTVAGDSQTAEVS